MTFIVRCFWHVLDPKQWFFCQITYVKLLLELSFLGVKGSTVILRARTSWSVLFDHKCTLFALLVLYIILDVYFLFKFSKSCMKCFRVLNKKQTFFSSLDLTGPLLLGGLMQLPVKFPVIYKHFTGCIRNVYIKFLDLSQPLTTTTESVLNVKQWATRAYINLASEARVLTYLVLVAAPLGLMEVAVKQVLNFYLRIC